MPTEQEVDAMFSLLPLLTTKTVLKQDVCIILKISMISAIGESQLA